MSKRINELLGLALDSEVPETWTTITHEQLTKVSAKFAELLVRECADVAYRYDGITLGQGYSVAKHIKQKLGIEE